MKQPLSAFLIVALTAAISCNSGEANKATTSDAPAFSIDSARAAITASNKTFGECWATGDSTKFAGCYSSDACINPPNMPRMCGSKAIMAFFNGGYQMGVRNIRITTEELFGGPEAVSEIGTCEMFADKNVSIDKGKFIVVWKQENGKWKMHRDVWNSDNPPPPPPPPAK